LVVSGLFPAHSIDSHFVVFLAESACLAETDDEAIFKARPWNSFGGSHLLTYGYRAPEVGNGDEPPETSMEDA